MTDVGPEFPSDFEIAAPVSGGPTPSLKRSSAARFFADVATLFFSIFSGIVTARALGAEGKGIFSSLSLVSGVILGLCSMGLGDAAIVIVGHKRATVQHALSVTVSATLGLSVLGGALLWVTAIVAFENDWAQVSAPAAIGSATMLLSLMGYELGFLLSAQERVVAHSAVVATTGLMTSFGLLLFLGVVHLGIAGGMLANALGAAAGFALGASLLKRSGLSLRPKFDGHYLAGALRYGAPVAMAYVLTVMMGRVDLLLAYLLAGSGPAGHYSVALALSAQASLLPIAISAATLPRLAKVNEAQANALTAQACRYGLAGAVSAAIVLFVTVPIGLPLVFGEAFAPAVAPTLILLPGSILASGMWLLCRAAAARGRPALLVYCSTLGLAVMVALDLVLIPRLGIIGAAVSGVAGPACAFLLSISSYRRSPAWTLPLGVLVPRISDFHAFMTQSVQLLPFQKGRGVQGAGDEHQSPSHPKSLDAE